MNQLEDFAAKLDEKIDILTHYIIAVNISKTQNEDEIVQTSITDERSGRRVISLIVNELNMIQEIRDCKMFYDQLIDLQNCLNEILEG